MSAIAALLAAKASLAFALASLLEANAEIRA